MDRLLNASGQLNFADVLRHYNAHRVRKPVDEMIVSERLVSNTVVESTAGSDHGYGRFFLYWKLVI
jgi:hypothetical protein